MEANEERSNEGTGSYDKNLDLKALVELVTRIGEHFKVPSMSDEQRQLGSDIVGTLQEIAAEQIALSRRFRKLRAESVEQTKLTLRCADALAHSVLQKSDSESALKSLLGKAFSKVEMRVVDDDSQPQEQPQPEGPQQRPTANA